MRSGWRESGEEEEAAIFMRDRCRDRPLNSAGAGVTRWWKLSTKPASVTNRNPTNPFYWYIQEKE